MMMMNLPRSPVLKTLKTYKHRMSVFHGISPGERLEATEEKTEKR